MEKLGELAERIFKDSSMGKNNMETLSNCLKDKSNKIVNLVEECKNKYQEYQEKSEKLLETLDIKTTNIGELAKIGSSRGVHMEMKKDNSDSHIADMLIQGFTMGEISMIKALNLYNDKVSKEELKLANEFKNWQKEMVGELKKFL